MTVLEQGPLVDGLAWSGFDGAVRHVPGGARAVFRAVDVPPDAVNRPGRHIPFANYVRCFEAAADLGGDPLFGFRFGSGTRAQRSGIPGYLVLNARRFRDAIRDLAHTLPTLVGGVQAGLVEDRDPPALVWCITAKVGPAAQFTAHANAYFVRMLQAHRGRQWRPLRVLYTIPEPHRADRYRAGLGCPVEFGAPVNAVELRREDLAAERVGADPHLHALLLTYANGELERIPVASDAVDAIRLVIRDGLALGRVDLGFVAGRLRRSERSVQRMLAGHGLSFTALRDQERLGLARTLVDAGTRTIADIATGLGYAETASFSRAFHARFGQSPRAARRTG